MIPTEFDQIVILRACLGGYPTRTPPLRRVARSALKVELLVASAAVDESSWLKLLLTEVGLISLRKGSGPIKMQCDVVVTDAESERSALLTSTVPRENWLMLDLQCLRSMVEHGDAAVHHIASRYNISDPLTKPARDAGVTAKLLPMVENENVVVLTW